MNWKRTNAGIRVATVAGFVACGSGGRDEVAPRPALIAEERLRIGSVDDAETAFTRAWAIRVAPDGRVFSLHDRERLVRVHAPDGSLIRSFGGEGEGPGEFLQPLELELFDDRLVVYDRRTLRASMFDLDGRLLTETTFRASRWDEPGWSVLRADGIYYDGSFYGEAHATAGPGGENIHAAPVLRYGADSAILDTLLMRPLDGSRLILFLGDEPIHTGQRFTTDPMYDVSASTGETVILERSIRPDTPRFTLTKINLDADTVWSREYAFRPVHYDPAVLDTFVNVMANNVLQAGFASSRSRVEAALRAGLHAPPYLPVSNRMVVGQDGSIWIELADRDTTSTRWLVLREDGEVVGEVDLPDRFIVRTATGNEIWGVDFDELDVPYLVKFTVAPAVNLERTATTR